MKAPSPSAQAEDATNRHEQESEQHEAYQYWGYLFKDDKTGSDRLKSLLRGLRDVINKNYEPSENPDLTPTQLASYYRELNGDYNQLFLGTPSAALAFIYKSLGCLHSLQPLAHSTAFTDPTVPALKTEGWIMWQTIQLLLAPDEHSTFLMAAVKRWDVINPGTGEVFPKILPRECFPTAPDKHMVAWYEGVSERLRQEAEDEQRQKDLEAQEAETKRIRARRHEDPGDEESFDSRTPAIAYFRNPLYRHVDGPYAGRPGIVRNSSNRPGISPHPSTIDKGKEPANRAGTWDVGRTASKDRERRRRNSVPHHHNGQPPPPTVAKPSSRPHSIHSHHRRRTSSYERGQQSAAGADDEWDQSETSPQMRHSQHAQPPRSHSNRRQSPYDSPLRHAKSHEPVPPQDYFEGYEDSGPPPRRNSAYDVEQLPAPTPNGIGPSFVPSASPLFASHVARQPQPMPPLGPPPQMSPQPPNMPPPGDPYYGNRPRKSSSLRHPPDRYPSPNPSRMSERYDSPRRSSRYNSPSRHHEHGMPPPPGHRPSASGGGGYYDGPMVPPVGRIHSPGRRSGATSDYDMPPPGHRGSAGSRYDGPRASSVGRRNSMGRRSGGSEYDMPMPPAGHRNSGARCSGSDLSGRNSGPEEQDEEPTAGGAPPRRPKVTRFVTPVSGVDGRRYPNEAPWR